MMLTVAIGNPKILKKENFHSTLREILRIFVKRTTERLNYLLGVLIIISDIVLYVCVGLSDQKNIHFDSCFYYL